MHWVLGIALAAAVFVILKQWGALTPEKKKSAIWKTVLVVGGALLLFMVLTGRVHVLTAAVAAVIPLLRKLPALIRFLPLLGGRSGRAHEPHGGGQGQYQEKQAASSGSMAPEEACEILGVSRDCSREDVIAAHRRLIQKLHPDRGGNDYLAAKINEAKHVLLTRYRA